MSDYSGDEGDDAYDFDEDYDDESQEPMISNKGKNVDRTVKFLCLNPSQLRARIDKDIEDVGSVLGIEHGLAQILLMHFRWNRDTLIDKYMDTPNSVLTAVGEPIPGTSQAPNGIAPEDTPRKRVRHSVSPPSPPSAARTCGVCYDACTDDDVPFRCGHIFCKDCWATYLTGKIISEGQCVMRCMGDRCKTVVDEAFMRGIVDDPYMQRWQTLVAESYIASDPDCRYCPHPSCEQVVHCAGARGSYLLTQVPSVECGADPSHPFCFGCGLDQSHAPVICKIATMWVNAKDSGTTEWIKANTRQCPRCNNHIEKAGGCNRMLCRHCKFQFCWMCKQDWSVHGYNDSVCNAFVEPPKSEQMNEASVNLERWLFYYDHFSNHELSAALDQELVDAMEDKILAIQESSNLSWIEAHFMQNAVNELTKCRQTLKWTYAMAHFLKKGNSKTMFEDIQADLEKAVEQLSQMLNEPLEEVEIKDLRQRVTNKTVYVQKRHEIMLDDASKGLAEGSWEWTVPIE